MASLWFTPQARALLACDWGVTIALPTETTRCETRAVRIIVLHYESTTLNVKLCERHMTMVLAETDSHDPLREVHK